MVNTTTGQTRMIKIKRRATNYKSHSRFEENGVEDFKDKYEEENFVSHPMTHKDEEKYKIY